MCHSVTNKYVNSIYSLFWLTNCHMLYICHRVPHQIDKFVSKNLKMYLTLCHISILCHSVTNKYVNSIYSLFWLTNCHMLYICHRVPHQIDKFVSKNLKMYLTLCHISILCHSVTNKYVNSIYLSLWLTSFTCVTASHIE